MSVLHIVNKSPYDRNSLDTCLRLAAPGSAILLIEDGVYAARRFVSRRQAAAGTGKSSGLRLATRFTGQGRAD